MRNQVARLGIYEDVKKVLDAAIASGGGTYICATHGQAVHWRQRAYKFRKLYAETVTASSIYDQLILRKIPPESSTVVIDVQQQVGQFIPAQQNAQPEPIAEEDELFMEAQAIAARIAKGDIL